MSESYQSNAGAAEIAQWLASRRRIAVLTHTKPDGDAVGSSLALMRALRELARREGRDPADIVAFYAGPLPHWIHDVAATDEFRDLGETALGVFGPDGAVITDTGAWAQLREAEGYLRPRPDEVAIIDHHIDGNASVGRRRWVYPGAAAACLMVAEVCRLLLGCEGLSELPAGVAQPLYLGLATDTGWFRHSNVSPEALRVGGELLDAGADHARLYEIVEQQDPPGRILLLGKALSGMELHLEGRLAILTIRIRDIHDARLQPGQSSGFADVPMHIGSVRVSAVLTEAEGGAAPLTKISLRSKAGDEPVDVNEVARAFGGGGHARAAGARAEGTIEGVKARLVEVVGGQLAER